MSWGIILPIVITVLALHYHRVGENAERVARRATRIELVGQLRAGLSSASEAEKSAVMATTDQESQAYAEHAREAMVAVGQQRDELAKLLEADGTQAERDLLSQFSQALAECERIDLELLGLAGQNTNLKAYDLAFGPAADALAEMDGALSRILKRGAASTAPDVRRVMLLVAEAQSGALRIQALLPPHISEEDDLKMDDLETRMGREDQNIRSHLKSLEAVLGPNSPDLEKAVSGYARFTELRGRILDLSRQNTNVRSLIISLNQKRKAAQMCQDALVALELAIRREAPPLPEPVRPR
jgi:hypothetical protein